MPNTPTSFIVFYLLSTEVSLLIGYRRGMRKLQFWIPLWLSLLMPILGFGYAIFARICPEEKSLSYEELNERDRVFRK
jgi:hypothetical protein